MGFTPAFIFLSRHPMEKEKSGGKKKKKNEVMEGRT